MTATGGDGALAPNRNLLATRVLIDELVRCGVTDLCLSPGSRSAPIALAAHADDRITVTVHTDERCGAFFALGLARAAQRPVALCCTSGTAGANYLPAVIEAAHSRIPLVILTADRPPELLDCGAPQTMDQIDLFGGAVRFTQAIGEPRADASWLRWLRTRVDRAVEAATGANAGPVHLDLHFGEPLSAAVIDGGVPAALAEEDGAGVLGRADGRPLSPWVESLPTVARIDLNRIGERLATAQRPVIIAGPGAIRDLAGYEAVTGLAQLLGAPVLADPLSRLRTGMGAPLISGYDAFLRVPAVAEALAPDVVLHLGRTPTCKHTWLWLERHREVDRIAIDPSPSREDPSLSGTEFVRAEPGWVAAALAPRMRRSMADPDWLQRWLDADAAVDSARTQALEDGLSSFEAHLIDALGSAMPSNGRLLVASSMPIRQLDAFWAGGPQQVVANRGVNGIDGLVSTAFGTAAADTSRPTWAVIGDLALLHDLGGLIAAPRLGLGLVLVVINNGGGGIFSYLPLASTEAAAAGGALEPLFLTPHATTFESAAQMFGLDYVRPTNATELRDALTQIDGRTRLVEFTVDREDSVARHRRFWTQVAEAVAP
jgi:2-succinyl-5-enolpyruvyl-6-hydroxy-3-cyclohexene-1-carboxylate synthase